MSDLKITSLADRVFERLESDILTGKYSKGELFTELGLSRELNVSRTPIREAIRRLEQENLVKETPKGHEVTGISHQDICEIYDIRMKIEGTATSMCAKNISDAELKRLNEILELQEFYTEKGEADKIKSVDSEFHEVIFASCGSEIYASILSTLHRKVQFGRKASVSDVNRAKEAVREHREIYKALVQRNAELAEALAIKHVNNAKINIMRLN